jgi:hypothetical protein
LAGDLLPSVYRHVFRAGPRVRSAAEDSSIRRDQVPIVGSLESPACMNIG